MFEGGIWKILELLCREPLKHCNQSLTGQSDDSLENRMREMQTVGPSS